MRCDNSGSKAPASGAKAPTRGSDRASIRVVNKAVAVAVADNGPPTIMPPAVGTLELEMGANPKLPSKKNVQKGEGNLCEAKVGGKVSHGEVITVCEA